MKEMSLSISKAFHFMEFRHSPMLMVNERALIVGLLAETARAYELAVLQEMRAPGAQTLALTELQLQNRMWITRYVFTPGSRNRNILYSIYRYSRTGSE
jgi:glucosamine--fructose-6-phosphate aminotransferase (isomerizing)